MAAYRRVYDSHHLQADCQEPGSAPRTLRSLSSMGCLFYLSLAKVEGDRMRLIRKFSKLKETRPTGPGAPTVCRYQWSYMYTLTSGRRLVLWTVLSTVDRSVAASHSSSVVRVCPSSPVLSRQPAPAHNKLHLVVIYTHNYIIILYTCIVNYI